MEGDGEGEDAPREGLGGDIRLEKKAPAGAVDVRFAGVGDGAENLMPVSRDGGKFAEEVAAAKPVAWLAEVFGGGFVEVNPVARRVENLDEDIGADGEEDAGVEEVSGVDDYGRAPASGFEGTQGREQVVYGTVALEKMHVLHSTKVALQGGGHDDDGDLGAVFAQFGCDFGAELACPQVIVEDGDVDLVEELVGFVDGSGGERGVTVLAEDSGAKMQCDGIIVEQQDGDVRGANEFEAGRCRWLWLHWRLDALEVRVEFLLHGGRRRILFLKFVDFAEDFGKTVKDRDGAQPFSIVDGGIAAYGGACRDIGGNAGLGGGDGSVADGEVAGYSYLASEDYVLTYMG